MKADLSPLRLLLLTLAGWVNRHQQQVIEYRAQTRDGAENAELSHP